jgi:3,4-dihydroxy 2-butanone 4-phosphate synthase/GTP cyclohydrolase II
MAGFEPAAVIVEIMNEDGTMARRPDLEQFAERHGLKIGTIADMIHYRALNEQTVVRQSEHEVDTEYGRFRLITFKDTLQGELHMALVRGDLGSVDAPLVRVQVPDILRDTLGVVMPGSQSWSVQRALERIDLEGCGVVVMLGGLAADDLAGRLDEFFNARPRNVKVNQGTYMTIGTGSQILRDLGITKMRLLNPAVKYTGISGFELEVVEFIPYQPEP